MEDFLTQCCNVGPYLYIGYECLLRLRHHSSKEQLGSKESNSFAACIRNVLSTNWILSQTSAYNYLFWPWYMVEPWVHCDIIVASSKSYCYWKNCFQFQIILLKTFSIFISKKVEATTKKERVFNLFLFLLFWYWDALMLVIISTYKWSLTIRFWVEIPVCKRFVQTMLVHYLEFVTFSS